MIFLLLIIVVLLFGFVVWFGAPYVPTLKPQTRQALDLLNLQKGQTLLELGCGDGRVMRAAAERGLRVVGYELNPLLVLVARVVTWRYRSTTKVIWGNYWRASWPEAEGIFVFLLAKYMKKLDKKIIQQRATQDHSIRLVSFTFSIPGKTEDKRQDGLFQYDYK